MDYLVSVVMILLSVTSKLSSGSDSQARSLDLSWRPLAHSPYQKQFFQNGPPASLISYENFGSANKEEIVEAAKHNAHMLKKFKEIAHQPITSYSDPYQVYSQTPGPVAKFMTTAAFLNPNLVRHQQQHQLVSQASNHVLSRVPYPVKTPLYQTKLNYLGKPDGNNAVYHQNSIHQTIGTTPKVAGFTKEHGRVHLHYHHPSFGVTPISTTKRIPMFSSSVMPHQHHGVKSHPVLSKFQVHMAHAAAASQHHHKLKQQSNFGFSPPSQVIANYASFGPATSNPFWHSGLQNNVGQFQVFHDNRDFHYQQQPEQQQQQQQQPQQQHQNQQALPNVHPSIITPFLDQVHLKQKEAAAAEQKNAFKQSHEANSQENSASFEIINDVFSKHLVPPPRNPSPTSFKPRPTAEEENQEKEKLNKYNLSMQSPLQDASRFNYNNVISTATPVNDILRIKPSASDYTFQTTEKPNVFHNLNRTKENVYKQHKLLHPSYTGGNRKKPINVVEKPFLPTPYKPDKPEEEIRYDYQPQHSFFTIEDAVTPNLNHEIVKSHIPVDEEPEANIYSPHRTPAYVYTTPVIQKTTTTTIAPQQVHVEQSTQKPRQKLRRRKQRPQQQMQQTKDKKESNEVQAQTRPARPINVRGNIKNVDAKTEQTELKTRNKVNHGNRVRNRFSLTSPAAVSTTLDYDSTVKTSTEEEKREELTPPQKVTTENPTSVKTEESSEAPENPKRRVRLRYKNKLRTISNPMETADFRPKLNDNQISDTEQESFVVKQSDETTESNLSTESGFNEIRSSLKLPNLKLRNDGQTTLPTTADTISTSLKPISTTGIEPELTNILNKSANRPRFSIKEYKRKLVPTSSTASTSFTSPSSTVTTAKPDSQRFNRLRLNLNRRRNETNESDKTSEEETEVPRKRYSSTRIATTTTTSTTAEAPTLTSSTPKRGSLPKRTFLTRNHTKPTTDLSESETTSINRIRNSTPSESSRTASPNVRTRIQSYKKKESLGAASDSTQDVIKNINFIAETSATQEQPTTVTTEASFKHETSIMKIAKTPSSVNLMKSTTSNFIDDTTDVSHSDFDLTGSPSEHSQRVAELTISGNENYSFKSANIHPLSRRIPNYFTISTDDPILPIQAFFPQINTNENN